MIERDVDSFTMDESCTIAVFAWARGFAGA